MNSSKKGQQNIWCDSPIADELQSMIQNFLSETTLLVSWSHCLPPRVLKVLPLGKSKAGTKKEIVEFYLHFKLSILFLDASTVQSGLQKLSIWGTFPFSPIFLLQNKRYFSLFSYTMKVQSKYEQKLTHLDRHHKKEQQHHWRKLCLSLGSNECKLWLPPKAMVQWPSSHSVCPPFIPCLCSFNFTELYCDSEQDREVS